MQYELESNSVYPILYHMPQNKDKNFLTLMRNAGVSTLNRYLELTDVVDKVYNYAAQLMDKEKMTEDVVILMMSNAIRSSYTEPKHDRQENLHLAFGTQLCSRIIRNFVEQQIQNRILPG